jgi:hypothetical protein
MLTIMVGMMNLEWATHHRHLHHPEEAMMEDTHMMLHLQLVHHASEEDHHRQWIREEEWEDEGLPWMHHRDVCRNRELL